VRIKVSLTPNPNHEIKKKQKNKTKQSYEKKMYPKLMLNKLKVMGNHTIIYAHWAPNSKEFFKKKSILHVAHVRPCSPMCEL